MFTYNIKILLLNCIIFQRNTDLCKLKLNLIQLIFCYYPSLIDGFSTFSCYFSLFIFSVTSENFPLGITSGYYAHAYGPPFISSGVRRHDSSSLIIWSLFILIPIKIISCLLSPHFSSHFFVLISCSRIFANLTGPIFSIISG